MALSRFYYNFFTCTTKFCVQRINVICKISSSNLSLNDKFQLEFAKFSTEFRLSFQLTWFKNGQRIRESQRVEMSHSSQQATLKIRVALPEDSGHYTLLSENPQGCTVSSAYLAIESSDQVDQAYQAPRETIKPQQVETTGESDSGKVLPPNFVRTCTDRDATEGKMTRYVCSIVGIRVTTYFANSRTT